MSEGRRRALYVPIKTLIRPYMPRDELERITITKKTKQKIIKLAEKLGLKQVTVLEYLLSGKLDLEELK
jgi:hypothetical protein